MNRIWYLCLHSETTATTTTTTTKTGKQKKTISGLKLNWHVLIQSHWTKIYVPKKTKTSKKTHVTYPYIFQHPHSHNLCWIAVEFFVFSALLLTARWRRDRETQCMTARRGIYQWFCPHALGKYPKLPKTPKKKQILHKLLVKHRGYLPRVCGWDLRK